MFKRARQAAIVGLSVSLVLMGCSSSKRVPKPPVTEKTVQPSASVTSVAPLSTLSIASATGEVPGSRVDVNALKRSNDSLRLDFTLTFQGTGSQLIVGAMHNPGTSPYVQDVSGVTLLDAPHAKEYRVLLKPDEGCRCTEHVGSVEQGKPVPMFAEFPLPPPEVKTVQVIVPLFTPMLDVPVDGSGARSSSEASVTPKPVATAAGDAPVNGATLEIYDVKRTHNFAILRFGWNPGPENGRPMTSLNDFPDTGASRADASGVRLVDQATQQRFLPLQDASTLCICSNYVGSTDLSQGGQTEVYWVEFPAPPPTTTTVEVHIPHFATLNVPVTGDTP